MSTPFFQQQRRTMMECMARGIGCAPADFEAEQLTVVDRPDASPWYSVFAVTFGVGTVMSVERRFRAFVEAHAPSPAYRSFYPVLMQRIVQECAAEGERLAYQVPGVCWALKEHPAAPTLPARFALRTVDAEWMKSEMRRGHWENGLGEPGAPDAREVRNRYGVAAIDSEGQPAAIAGVFESYGLHEIGVDVRHAHRGLGLGAAVVTAAAREILDRGHTPLYGCAATNIRSQRTALTAGFLPAYADAAVSVASPAPGTAA